MKNPLEKLIEAQKLIEEAHTEIEAFMQENEDAECEHAKLGDLVEYVAATLDSIDGAIHFYRGAV